MFHPPDDRTFRQEALYGHAGFSWALFPLFFLSPDLAMRGYLVGPKVGAATYNLVSASLRVGFMRIAAHNLKGARDREIANRQTATPFVNGDDKGGRLMTDD
jgi:hypothetical protein